jgi:hypothetical protein
LSTGLQIALLVPARGTLVLGIFHTWRHLASRHNDRWGVTLFDWGVRLNVGWVECLVLRSGGLRVLVDKDVAPPDSVFDGRNYKLAPGCDTTTVPLSELPRRLPPLEELHYAALSSAARRRSPPHIRGAHSVGVTKLLSLPNPSYVSSARDSVLAGRDEEATQTVFLEGGRGAVLVNRFERDPSARMACIAHHGMRCSVCGMSFGERHDSSD